MAFLSRTASISASTKAKNNLGAASFMRIHIRLTYVPRHIGGEDRGEAADRGHDLSGGRLALNEFLVMACFWYLKDRRYVSYARPKHGNSNGLTRQASLMAGPKAVFVSLAQAMSWSTFGRRD